MTFGRNRRFPFVNSISSLFQDRSAPIKKTKKAKQPQRPATRFELERLEDRLTPDSSSLAAPFLFTGTEAGTAARLKAYFATTGQLAWDIPVFGGFNGGIKVASGDIDHDGINDAVISASTIGGPRVQVISGATGTQIAGKIGSFYAYAEGFTGGVRVATGDFNGDGWTDIATAPIKGTAPHVKIFSGKDATTSTYLASFYAFEETFTGGVSIAVGDFNDDGRDDLALGSGEGRAPLVKLVRVASNSTLPETFNYFAPFATTHTGGMQLAASSVGGDFNGDGYSELVVGQSTGSSVGNLVKVFDVKSTPTLLSTLNPFNVAAVGGVQVAVHANDSTQDPVVVAKIKNGNTYSTKVIETKTYLPTTYSGYTPLGYVGTSTSSRNVVAEYDAEITGQAELDKALAVALTPQTSTPFPGGSLTTITVSYPSVGKWEQFSLLGSEFTFNVAYSGKVVVVGGMARNLDQTLLPNPVAAKSGLFSGVNGSSSYQDNGSVGNGLQMNGLLGGFGTNAVGGGGTVDPPPVDPPPSGGNPPTLPPGDPGTTPVFGDPGDPVPPGDPSDPPPVVDPIGTMGPFPIIDPGTPAEDPSPYQPAVPDYILDPIGDPNSVPYQPGAGPTDLPESEFLAQGNVVNSPRSDAPNTSHILSGGDEEINNGNSGSGGTPPTPDASFVGINQIWFNEGNSGTTYLEISVVHTGNVNVSNQVAYTVSHISTDNADFGMPGSGGFSGILDFKGSSIAKIRIPVYGDTVSESNENFQVSLSNYVSGTTNGTVGKGAGSSLKFGTIVNDDAVTPSVFSISALTATMAEGNSGSKSFSFKIDRNNAANAGAVSWSVAASGNLNAADFEGGVLPSGTVSFNSSEISKTIFVNVSGDTAYESDEPFVVSLASPAGGTISPTAGTATGIIQNDDAISAPLVFSTIVGNANQTEGNSGSKAFTFIIARTNSTSAATINWSVGASGSLNAADFVGGVLPSGSVSFAVGEYSTSVSVYVNGDTTAENNENFVLALSNPSSGTIDPVYGSATGTIVDDDTSGKSVFSIAASSAVQAEGNSGTKAFNFTIQRTNPSNTGTSVTWYLTGSGSLNGSDFLGAGFPSGTAYFSANESSKTISIFVNGDIVQESDENFYVLLTDPVGGTIDPDASSSWGTILNDDSSSSSVFSVLASAAELTEGNSGSKIFTFNVLRSIDVSSAATIKWSVIGLDTTNGADFAGGTLPTGTLSFAAGESQKTIEILVNGDTDPESDEIFNVTLSSPSSGKIDPAFITASGKIISDDGSAGQSIFSILANNATQWEGSSGSKPFTFTVKRTNFSSSDATIYWSLTSSANPSPDDFQGSTSGMLSFTAGESSKTLTIYVNGDTTQELDETFTVFIVEPSTGTISPFYSSANGTILNDDFPVFTVGFASQGVSFEEGNSGPGNMVFYLNRTNVPWGSPGVSVRYTVTPTGKSAAAASDFPGGTFPSGVVTFDPNQVQTVLNIPINGDRDIELNESFIVTLSSLENSTPAPSAVINPSSASAKGTILNDDAWSRRADALTGDSSDILGTPGALIGDSPSQYTSSGVRSDGSYSLGGNDLFGGTMQGLSRQWGSQSFPNLQTSNLLGNGSTIGNIPQIMQQADFGAPVAGMPSYLFFVNGQNAYDFYPDKTNANYFGSSLYGNSTLFANTAKQEIQVTDGMGKIFKFYDFSANIPSALRGTLKSTLDTYGYSTTIVPDDITRQIKEIQTTNINIAPESRITEIVKFDYITAGVNAGLISKATLSRKTPTKLIGLSYTEYSYYPQGSSNGLPGDLRSTKTIKGTSTVTTGDVIDQTYYRYFTTNAAGAVPHGLSYVLGNASYARLMASNPSSTFDNLSNAAIAPFADEALTYDPQGRVLTHTLAGAGNSQAATNTGLGTYRYSYQTNTANPAFEVNTWSSKVRETLPDGNVIDTYSNGFGQTMLQAYIGEADFDGNTPTWVNYYKYNSYGQVTLKANPSVGVGYNPSLGGLIVSGGPQDSRGLVEVYEYGTSTFDTQQSTPGYGNVKGYLKATYVQNGLQGTAVKTGSVDYLARSGLDGRVQFFTAHSADAANNSTKYEYTWQPGQSLTPQSITITLPAIAGNHNGSGNSISTVQVFDNLGRPTWSKDASGIISYADYDLATGAVLTAITDVDTSKAGLNAMPFAWFTPTGAGLHLTSTQTVDDFGRTTKSTDPFGVSTFYFYNDKTLETRVYPGYVFDSATGTTSSLGLPTQISRTDLARGYVESITASPVASGAPTGSEGIVTNTGTGLKILSMSRAYANLAGQITDTYDYFDFTNLTYSTNVMGTVASATIPGNFYRTLLSYDDMGRQNRMQSPSGTISRSFYDQLGRTSSVWVGTNDNADNTNMAKVASYEYDNGGIGDSNVTRTISYPTGIYDKQVTQTWYDWRDRPIAVKTGIQTGTVNTINQSENDSVHRSLAYMTYNDLNQVISSLIFDGDNLNSSTAAQPTQPAESQALGKTVNQYDEWGRVYRSTVFARGSNNQLSTTGVSSDVWFDDNGNLIKSTQPGGLVSKTKYDIYGRPIASYITDGGGDTNWTSAGTVLNDLVFSQSEVQYDRASNPIITTSRERFHDSSATGELTASNSRAYYSANYYDKLGQLVSSVSLGTNTASNGAATPFTLASYGTSAPARSDTVLRTDYTRGSMATRDDMWSQVTDSKGIASRQYVDSLGRTKKTIEAYDGINTTISATANKTTEYFFDYAGRLSTVQATLPSGKKQQTGYVYGASFATGSFINSNDIMVATQYAASSTNPALDGLASADEQVTQTVDATGQVLTTLDRNGTKHVFKYDVLGRVIADTVAMRGTAIDNSVRRMEVAYDAQGNAATMSTYSDVKGGSIVNQVQRVFNGLGQLTTEYQSHSGAVVTNVTPKVGYTYADPTLGNNGGRQTGMVYPNGRALTYNYDSGVDNNISRLSSISDTSGTLESYQYMGLSTVVVRDHPLNGVSLTYVKKSTESMGDAGDNYTGLDRFGRVVDQRWVKNVGGTVTDIERFQYTYDRASNVLSKVNAIDSTKTENYAYDNLNQLTTFTRGGTTRTQNFTADGMGNFSSVINISNGTSTTQTRTHNAQNELVTISGTAATPTYDANGNLTKDETGALLTYDAWNRLVKVIKGSATVTYSYDALGRRVTESVNGATKDLYYSKDWQVLEERTGGTAKTQYVWSPVYVDAMIERDRDASSTVAGLEERIWSLHDANFNTTALVTSTGTVTERFLYDPYGRLTDASGSAATPSTTNDWIYLHQGGRLDTTTGLYNFRNRDYSPTLMRWTTNDPIGFGGRDTNTYRYVGNGPTGALDPSGLRVWEGPTAGGGGGQTDTPTELPQSTREKLDLIANASPEQIQAWIDEVVLDSHKDMVREGYRRSGQKAPSTDAEWAAYFKAAGEQGLRFRIDARKMYLQALADAPRAAKIREIQEMGDSLGNTVKSGADILFQNLNKPYGWMRSIEGVVEEPTNPLSYMDFFIAGTGKLGRIVRYGTGGKSASGIAALSGTPGVGSINIAQKAGSSSGKSLLAGEGAVGTYDDLIAAGVKGDNITPHHIPSANFMKQHGVAKGDGISINMEHLYPGRGGRHRRTLTYGTNADIGLSARDALSQGVRDVRRIYQEDGLYDAFIRQKLKDLIQQNKQARPDLFIKKASE